VDQVPVKVLRSVAMRLVDGLTSSDHGSVCSSTSIDSDVTHVTSNCIDACSPSLKDDLAPTDDDSIAGELRIPDTSDMNLELDKAAKADDAEAVAEDWDRWTVENFDGGSLVSTPIICTGYYDSQ
jgi:hypothetical protein